MCFGAIVMTGIRKVRYAARDGLAGSAVLTGATPYIASKQISVALEGSSLEVFQIALTTAFELRRQHPRQEVILSCLRADCPEGVALGTRLFQEGFFPQPVGKAGKWSRFMKMLWRILPVFPGRFEEE